jgi:RimJ/RimL family protein N-acetyltransferase
MTPAVPILETPRLILRPMDLSDADAVQARFPRWEIVRLLESVVPWPYPEDGALTYIRTHVLPPMQQGVAWHWSIRPKQTPEDLIGAIALRDKPGDNRGFWLDPAWQGQGLMTEASDAVTDFWFETLDRPLLQVMKAVANVKSRRLSQRVGMRMVQVSDHDFVCGRLPAELWEITREEWRRRPR